MWIPQTASEKSVIAGLVGVPAMTRLVAEFGEGKIAMPTLKNLVLDCRNAKLLGMMQKGTCDHDLVDVAAISRRRLQQLRKEFSAIGLL